MTIGIGGSAIQDELKSLICIKNKIKPIETSENLERINKLTGLMKQKGIEATFLDCSSNLNYFTSIKLSPSERLHGAIIFQNGQIVYICPEFEKQKTKELIKIEGEILTWQENENPSAILINLLNDKLKKHSVIAIDEMAPLFTFDGILKANTKFKLIIADQLTKQCRIIKSKNEIALIKTAMKISLEAQKVTARILFEGISTTEVQKFLVDAHLILGAEKPPLFNIVLFGQASAYPHGVNYEQYLKNGDMVLIDVGAEVGGYYSDITRTYVFGDTNQFQKEIWELEKKAQKAIYNASKIGVECEKLDKAAREVITAGGLGPKYNTPGLPHRAGHGIGLDIHEHPYIVEGNSIKLSKGMCFSNEPSICIYGKFGVRLEDHIYMTDKGPKWFTKPSFSFEDPFGYKE